MKQFTSKGIGYVIDDFGVIHQSNPRPFVYDEKYVSTYDTPEYQRGNDILQALRIGFVIGVYGGVPKSILDVGYGNGAFLKAAQKLHGIRVFGKDVTGVDVPGAEIVDTYINTDVTCFWDCFEHIPDLSFIRDIPSKLVVISLPFCHYFTKGSAWFDSVYKHRKPDEHLHHFNESSLKNIMYNYGWVRLASSSHEDVVRKGTHGLQNILTMAFSRK